MSTPRLRFFPLAALAVLALAVTAAPAAASPDGPSPLFGSYIRGFIDHWTGMLQKQNGVVLFALGVGAVSLFIITRGKWRK
jgi:hypothetical protein